MWLFNSHKKLSNINIRSSWSQFEHCSKSLIYPLGSHTCSLFAQFHMDSWPKVKLGRHYVPLLGLSTLIWPPIYHFGPDFALFIYIFQYLALFTYIYPHLPLICPYLVIFTLNCPNLTIYRVCPNRSPVPNRSPPPFFKWKSREKML